jgi:hypothetical protein
LRGFLEFATINLEGIYSGKLYVTQHFVVQLAASARRKGKEGRDTKMKGRRKELYMTNVFVVTEYFSTVYA